MDELKKKLQSIYGQLKNEKFEEISNRLLLRTVLEILLDIDFRLLDIEKTNFRISDEDCFQISFISSSNLYCPIYLEGLKNTTIDIQLNEGGEYLYMQPIESWNDLYRLKEALNDIFYSKIEEILIYRGDKLCKATYIVPHNVEGEILKYKYSVVFSGSTFYKRRKKIYNKFNAWGSG